MPIVSTPEGAAVFVPYEIGGIAGPRSGTIVNAGAVTMPTTIQAIAYFAVATLVAVALLYALLGPYR